MTIWLNDTTRVDFADDPPKQSKTARLRELRGALSWERRQVKQCDKIIAGLVAKTEAKQQEREVHVTRCNQLLRQISEVENGS